MILMIDNYDSFTYNLVQYLGEIGEDVKVVRNDQIDVDEIKTMRPDHIVISPGPCTPNEAGISLDTISALGTEVPILGVCLGHQSIGQAYGGSVVRAQNVMHGKTSKIHHNNKHIFKQCSNPFTATRYHSLIIDKTSVPDCLEITAWTQTDSGEVDEIMGVRHKKFDVEGVQFHPESILTDFGHLLLKNFIHQNRKHERTSL
ncbi:MAG: aminodeoxychorismate/anthranilate synthase component II [Gammaproteobacteria bacterium]|nr:aminodeoxychorismate/anthranilate synthase component II [Gammaproteobacteria bacterium]